MVLAPDRMSSILERRTGTVRWTKTLKPTMLGLRCIPKGPNLAVPYGDDILMYHDLFEEVFLPGQRSDKYGANVVGTTFFSHYLWNNFG